MAQLPSQWQALSSGGCWDSSWLVCRSGAGAADQPGSSLATDIVLECPEQWLACIALAQPGVPSPTRAVLYSAAELGPSGPDPAAAWAQSSHVSFR